MLVSELYAQVAGLGFEDTLENSGIFYNAANRALLQVNAIRPAIRSYIINHKPMENIIDTPSFSPIVRTETLCFEASDARSYYFEADGTGHLYIERCNASGEWLIIDDYAISSADGGYIAYKGFIKDGDSFVSGQVRLRFEGEYAYSLKNVAMYRYLYSGLVLDIPAYEEYKGYDISALTDDFLGLEPAAPVRESNPDADVDYRVEDGGVIYLPYNDGGCFKILYRHKPRKLEHQVSPLEDGSVIDMDSDLCALLPLLVASYVWLEDEPEKAEYYRYMYQQGAADIERKHRNAAPVRFINRSGW